jgi:hypothetical protein
MIVSHLTVQQRNVSVWHERVDECGHVSLTDAEVTKLSKTRHFSIFFVVVGLSAPKQTAAFHVERFWVAF